MTHRLHQSSSQFIRVALLALLLAALAPFVHAQTQPAAPVGWRVQVIRTNPGMPQEWRQFYQTEIMPALKKAGVKQRNVLRVVQGDVYEFVIISPLENLAQLDEPTSLAKALGQEAAQTLNNKQSRLLSEWRLHTVAARPDLGIALTSNEPAKLLLSIKYTVAPGRTAEYEKWIKENVVIAGKKADSKGVLAGKVILGGNTNEYRTLIPFDSYAEMMKFQMAITKAAAELKLALTPPAGVVESVEITVLRPVPELSIQPAAQKAAP